MELTDVKVGLQVEIAYKKDSPHYLKEATVLSIYREFSKEEYIRLRLDDGSGEIITGFKACDLEAGY